MSSKSSRSPSCVGERQQHLLLHQVDLVEDEDLGLAPALERVEHLLEPPEEAGLGVDDQGDQVRVRRPRPGRRHHRPVEPPLRLEDAGRVEQQYLRLAGDGDAHQPGAGGLRLGADDRHLLPDQRIDQGRLARIGRADDGDEAAFLGHFSCSRSFAAAAVSASCFDAPSALAEPTPLISTSTTKVGACCGPERSARR